VIPLLILFEASIWLSKIMEKRWGFAGDAEEDMADDDEDAAETDDDLTSVAGDDRALDDLADEDVAGDAEDATP